jgi:hypothetical protein
MPDKQELHQLIDQLPETELTAAARYLQFLLAQDAPVDAEMLARIDEARGKPSAGITHEDILREYGL